MSVRVQSASDVPPAPGGAGTGGGALPAAWMYLGGAICWLSLWGAPSTGLRMLGLTGATLLSACAMAAFRSPGDRRGAHLAALASAGSMCLAVPLLPAGAYSHFLLLLAVGFVCWFVSGRAAAIPNASGRVNGESFYLWAHAGADAATLGSFHLRLARTPVAELARIRDELARARAVCREAGWLDRPETFHAAPPELTDEDLERRHGRAAGLSFEHLSAESGYQPPTALPGADRWSARVANRTTHAWVVRDEEPAAPWIVCVHGFGLGRPALDFRAFGARWLHRQRGCNLLFPVLPLHGPRADGWVSGNGFFSGDPLDTVHAVAQGVHDIRRWAAWAARQAEAPPAMFGISLGAYHAALVASLVTAAEAVDALDRVLLGTPLVDIEETLWVHGPASWREAATAAGVFRDDLRDLYRVISPLRVPPPKIAAAMFVASADRLITPWQAPALANHWPHATVAELPSAHVTFRLTRGLRGVLEAHLPGRANAYLG